MNHHPRILIVKLSALGDIVHALPLAGAIRDSFPEARLDWLVDTQYAGILNFVPVLNNRIAAHLHSPAVITGASGLIRLLRNERYDCAIDAQGLFKSAILARLSGARRVIGFSRDFLREKAAANFYTETVDPPPRCHSVRKNLALLNAFGITPGDVRFPLLPEYSEAPAHDGKIVRMDDDAPFALLIPDASRPNKQWPPERMGELAALLRQHHGLKSLVSSGIDHGDIAATVATAAGGAARVIPQLPLGEFVRLVRNAAVVVAGDTGPMHIAAGVGTPVVALHGPTDPIRNGPWTGSSVVVSRFDACACRYGRNCRSPVACIAEITVDEVLRAVKRCLAYARAPVGETVEMPGALK